MNIFRSIVEMLFCCPSLLSLSRGPSQYLRCFKGYVANGYRFRIEASDIKSRTQNSGVCVLGDIGNETNFVDYYGVLTEILELQYLDEKRLVSFRCKWFDVHDKEKGAKIDEYGFTSINCNRLLKTNEPFILASQASQVFYVNDNINKGWNVVVKMQHRDLYEMGQPVDEESINTDDLGEAYQHSESFNYDCNNSNSADADGQNIWIRTDSEPTIVGKTITKRKRKRKTF